VFWQQGAVEQMDTLNPVLYMDFPQGRLKFMGTIVHGTNRWLTLSFGKRHVLCEDCFDHVVVFADWSWVGKKSVNPDERRLPLPMELRDLKVHASPNFAAGAAGTFPRSQPRVKLAFRRSFMYRGSLLGAKLHALRHWRGTQRRIKPGQVGASRRRRPRVKLPFD
jgi:hypothetical protein